MFGEDLYARESVRYGKDAAPLYRDSVFGTDATSKYPDVVYQGDISGTSSLNESFKQYPDDSVSNKDLKEDYMEAQITSSAYAPAYASRPDNRYAPGAGGEKQGEAGRYSSYSGSSFSTSFDPDNVPVDRAPVYSGFLISFMVDARGGAMRGCRHSGVRIIIPPRKASMPTRVTCRLLKKEKLLHPPHLNEGEGLAARILEMGPVGTKFLGPIIIEVPHFASLRGKEREVVIMRSDNGKNWYEHPMVATEEAVSDALGGSLEGAEGVTPTNSQSGSVSSLWKLDQEEELTAKRITRILTTDFPQYFALVTKIRQENKQIGEDGGVISSTVVPQVQAVFPEGALTKTIRVGLQAQPIAPELVAKQLGNRVAVSPIVTVEPRRRKFHKPITLTIPVPKASQKGMINQYGGDRPTLRLLYSISGNNSHNSRGENEPAVWEDITDAKPMTLVNDCVSFTTTVSARFWLIDCQNIQDATQMATALYKESIIVPYMAKFVIFAKRDSAEEGKLRMFCMTDDKVDKTLEKQEKFAEVARSRDIEVMEGRPQFVEMAGNLIPVTKSGDQLHVNFKSFRENRLPCTVKIRDLDQDPSARVAFMKEPKVARGEAPQSPICNLNITLPDMSKSDSSLEMDPDALEVRKRHSLLREHGIVVKDTVSRGQMKLTDIADTLQGDWVILAQQLDITMSEINRIKTEYNTVNDQALAMLHLWVEKNKEKATGNALESALRKINREDVVEKCMYNVETVEDEMEAAAARVAMDQSGFDTFKEEVGITKDSMKRGMSLDVQYDEQDLIKESESAAEESSPSSERGSLSDKPAPKVEAEATSSRPESITEEQILADLDVRRDVAKVESPEEKEEVSRKKKEAYVNLVGQMDRLLDEQEAQERISTQVSEEHTTITEESIVAVAKGSPEDPMQRVQQAPAQAPCVDVESDRSPSESSMVVKGDQDVDEYGDEEVIRTPPPSPSDKQPITVEEHHFEDEEEHEEVTEIEEIFQISEDGETWKTVRKVTTITPRGTTEKTEILKEEKISRVSNVEEAAARLAAEAGMDQSDTGETAAEREPAVETEAGKDLSGALAEEDVIKQEVTETVSSTFHEHREEIVETIQSETYVKKEYAQGDEHVVSEEVTHVPERDLEEKDIFTKEEVIVTETEKIVYDDQEEPEYLRETMPKQAAVPDEQDVIEERPKDDVLVSERDQEPSLSESETKDQSDQYEMTMRDHVVIEKTYQDVIEQGISQREESVEQRETVFEQRAETVEESYSITEQSVEPSQEPMVEEVGRGDEVVREVEHEVETRKDVDYVQETVQSEKEEVYEHEEKLVTFQSETVYTEQQSEFPQKDFESRDDKLEKEVQQIETEEVVDTFQAGIDADELETKYRDEAVADVPAYEDRVDVEEAERLQQETEVEEVEETFEQTKEEILAAVTVESGEEKIEAELVEGPIETEDAHQEVEAEESVDSDILAEEHEIVKENVVAVETSVEETYSFERHVTTQSSVLVDDQVEESHLKEHVSVEEEVARVPEEAEEDEELKIDDEADVEDKTVSVHRFGSEEDLAVEKSEETEKQHDFEDEEIDERIVTDLEESVAQEEVIPKAVEEIEEVQEDEAVEVVDGKQEAIDSQEMEETEVEEVVAEKQGTVESLGMEEVKFEEMIDEKQLSLEMEEAEVVEVVEEKEETLQSQEIEMAEAIEIVEEKQETIDFLEMEEDKEVKVVEEKQETLDSLEREEAEAVDVVDKMPETIDILEVEKPEVEEVDEEQKTLDSLEMEEADVAEVVDEKQESPEMEEAEAVQVVDALEMEKDEAVEAVEEKQETFEFLEKETAEVEELVDEKQETLDSLEIEEAEAEAVVVDKKQEVIDTVEMKEDEIVEAAEEQETIDSLKMKEAEVAEVVDEEPETIDSLEMEEAEAVEVVDEKQETIDSLEMKEDEAIEVVDEKQETFDEMEFKEDEAVEVVDEKQETIESLELKEDEVEEVDEKQETIDSLEMKEDEAVEVVDEKQETIDTSEIEEVVREKQENVPSFEEEDSEVIVEQKQETFESLESEEKYMDDYVVSETSKEKTDHVEISDADDMIGGQVIETAESGDVKEEAVDVEETREEIAESFEEVEKEQEFFYQPQEETSEQPDRTDFFAQDEQLTKEQVMVTEKPSDEIEDRFEETHEKFEDETEELTGETSGVTLGLEEETFMKVETTTVEQSVDQVEEQLMERFDKQSIEEEEEDDEKFEEAEQDQVIKYEVEKDETPAVETESVESEEESSVAKEDMVDEDEPEEEHKFKDEMILAEKHEDDRFDLAEEVIEKEELMLVSKTVQLSEEQKEEYAEEPAITEGIMIVDKAMVETEIVEQETVVESEITPSQILVEATEEEAVSQLVEIEHPSEILAGAPAEKEEDIIEFQPVEQDKLETESSEEQEAAHVTEDQIETFVQKESEQQQQLSDQEMPDEDKVEAAELETVAAEKYVEYEEAVVKDTEDISEKVEQEKIVDEMFIDTQEPQYTEVQSHVTDIVTEIKDQSDEEAVESISEETKYKAMHVERVDEEEVATEPRDALHEEMIQYQTSEQVSADLQTELFDMVERESPVQVMEHEGSESKIISEEDKEAEDIYDQESLDEKEAVSDYVQEDEDVQKSFEDEVQEHQLEREERVSASSVAEDEGYDEMDEREEPSAPPAELMKAVDDTDANLFEETLTKGSLEEERQDSFEEDYLKEAEDEKDLFEESKETDETEVLGSYSEVQYSEISHETREETSEVYQEKHETFEIKETHSEQIFSEHFEEKHESFEHEIIEREPETLYKDDFEQDDAVIKPQSQQMVERDAEQIDIEESAEDKIDTTEVSHDQIDKVAGFSLETSEKEASDSDEEPWEMLEKEELSQEELVAASSDTLMSKSEPHAEEPEESDSFIGGKVLQTDAKVEVEEMLGKKITDEDDQIVPTEAEHPIMETKPEERGKEAEALQQETVLSQERESEMEMVYVDDGTSYQNKIDQGIVDQASYEMEGGPVEVDFKSVSELSDEDLKERKLSASEFEENQAVLEEKEGINEQVVQTGLEPEPEIQEFTDDIDEATEDEEFAETQEPELEKLAETEDVDEEEDVSPSFEEPVAQTYDEIGSQHEYVENISQEFITSDEHVSKEKQEEEFTTFTDDSERPHKPEPRDPDSVEPEAIDEAKFTPSELDTEEEQKSEKEDIQVDEKDTESPVMKGEIDTEEEEKLSLETSSEEKLVTDSAIVFDKDITKQTFFEKSEKIEFAEHTETVEKIQVTTSETVLQSEFTEEFDSFKHRDEVFQKESKVTEFDEKEVSKDLLDAAESTVGRLEDQKETSDFKDQFEEKAESVETESVESQPQLEAETVVRTEAVPWTVEEQQASAPDEDDLSDEDDLGASREPTSDSDTIPEDAKFDDDDLSPSKTETAITSEEKVKESELEKTEIPEEKEKVVQESTTKSTTFESFSFTQHETVVEHAVSYYSDEDMLSPTEEKKSDQIPEQKDLDDIYTPEEAEQEQLADKSASSDEKFVPQKMQSLESSMTTSMYEPGTLEDLEEPQAVESDLFIDRKEVFTEEFRSFTSQKLEAEALTQEFKEDEGEEYLEESFVDRKEYFIEEVVESLSKEGSKTDGGYVLFTEDSEDAGQSTSKAASSEHASTQGDMTFRPSPNGSSYLGLHAPLLPTSSTEVHDRSGTPSDIEPDDLEPQLNQKVVALDASERAASPIEYSYESRPVYEESDITGVEESDITGASADDEMEPEGRITADTSQQIFIEQAIESRKPPKGEGYSSGDEEDRPPSPSEFTLVQSHDQDMLMKALGIEQTIEEDQSSEDDSETENSESDDNIDRPPSPTEFTLVASQDQDTLCKVLDDSEPDYAPQEEGLIYVQDSEVPAKYGFGEDDLARDPLSDGFTTGTSSAEAPDASEHSSSEQAQKDTLDQSVENNTMSTLSSEMNEPAGQVEPSAPPLSPFNELSEDGTVMTSSYEKIYQGIKMDMTTHSEQIIEIGDHFDTKQQDIHLQPAERSSSYEDLYQEGEMIGQSAGTEDILVAKTERDETMSSVSSEVTQVLEVHESDAEKREPREEKTEETDVEEQFSPLSKQQTPAKQALNLEFDSQKTSLSFSQTSPDIVVSSQLEQSQDGLSVPSKPLLVGPSPSDQLSTVLEGEEEHDLPASQLEEEQQDSPREGPQEVSEICSESMEVKVEQEFQHSEKVTFEERLQFSPDEREDAYIRETKEDVDFETTEKEHEFVYSESVTTTTTTILDSTSSEIAKEESEFKSFAETQETMGRTEETIEMTQSLDSTVETEKITKEERDARISYMAFDNMGFSAEDTDKGAEAAPSLTHSYKLEKQDTKEISPEDLEEKPWQFEFPDDFKQELEQKQQTEDELRREEEEGETFGSAMETATCSQFAASSMTQSFHESYTEMYDEQRPDLVLEQEHEERVYDQLLDTTQIVTESKPDILTDHEAKQETELTEREILTQQIASSIVADKEPAEQDDVDSLEESVSDSSSDRDTQVFDEASGTFRTVPWEVAHQFKRQFSESFVEQDKKIKLQHSIDMGDFYRRKEEKTMTTHTHRSETEYDEVLEQSVTVKTSQKVTFKLSSSEEETEVFGQQLSPETSALEAPVVSEPHDMIKETHEAEVISTILESRQHVKEEIAKQEDVPEFFEDDKDEDDFLAKASKFESETVFSQQFMSSYTSNRSSSEQYYEKSEKKARFSRDDSTDSRDEDLFTVQSFQPISVVSKESRLAQQELLQEMGDEKDRSLSPSVDSEELSTTYESQVELQEELGGIHHQPPQVPSKFPMAVHSLSKALADNEIYESSETERDSTEEKLSPIEEAPSGEGGMDEISDEPSGKTEKRVTFQTDTLFARTQELHGSEEVKTSTSSSEVSMEPTLLAASYDLDTGHVSHVVAAFDISPEAIEKQHHPEATPKAILSSPEDDVFETDGTLVESEEKDQPSITTSSRDSGSDLYPSPPAPTPMDSVLSDTTCDLATASSKLEEIHDRQVEDAKYEEDEISETPKHTEDDELSSPFEIMSPSELTDQGLSTEIDGKMVTSLESETGSYTEVVVDEQGQTTTESRITIPNGPTEVEYQAEYDEFVEQPSFHQGSLRDQESDQIHDETSDEQKVFTESLEEHVEVQFEVTEGEHAVVQDVREEDQPIGQSQAAVSEQTLYGYDMPSDEVGAVSVSTSYKESIGMQEIDQDSEMTQPPTEITLQTDEASTEYEISETKVTEDAQVKDQVETETSEVKDKSQEEDEEKGYIYPGKRALEIDFEPQGAYASEYATDQLGTEEQQQYFSPSDSEDGLDEYVDQEEERVSFSVKEEYKESKTVTTVFTEHIVTSDVQLVPTFEVDEPLDRGESDFVERPEEELIQLKDSKTASEADETESANAAMPVSTEKAEQLDVTGLPDDLDRPISPTPDAVRQSYFGDDDDELLTSELLAAEEEVLEITASSFVEAILDDVKQKVHDDRVQEYAAMEASAVVIEPDETSFEEPAVAITTENGDVDKTDESEEELEPPPASPPPPIPPLPLFRKQVSEDIPEITITQHLHEERDEGDYPLCFAEKYTGVQCVPEEEDVEEEEVIATSVVKVSQKPDETDSKDIEEEEPAEETDPFLGMADSESTPSVLKEVELVQQELVFHQSETIEAETGSTPVNEEDKLAKEFELRVEISDGMRPYDYSELMSPEDHGDSSSVDSFATVVAAQPEEEEDDDEEDRLADFASLTSSIHSEPTHHDTTSDLREEDEDEIEEEEPEEILEWPRHSYENDRERDNDSLLESDRYEFVDRTALSVITEMSDEDRFEMIEREEALSEGGGSDQVQGSPEGPPGVSKFVGKSGEKDDVSISSSLLEFENLEKEINQSSSISSIELGEKESLGGSLDERRFPANNKASDREDAASVASSLAEFERLERDIAVSGSLGSMEKVSGSLGSMEKVAAESKSSNGTGSLSSLTEFEKYERECATDSEDRRGSLGSMSRKSDASSHPSLAEFETLEHEIKTTEELEVEAQKIVTILESGSFFATSKIYTSSQKEVDRDSLDSLSEGEKTGHGDADSLDGDTSELTDMTSSVIFTGAIVPVVPIPGEATSGGEMTSANELDSDSLHGESAMQLSSDSLGREYQKPLKDVYDTDSLHETDGAMDRSADSIELCQRLESGQIDMAKSADSVELERQLLVEAGFMITSTDSLELGQPETVMEKSTDSLELDLKAEVDQDSLQGQDDQMHTSADSLELDIVEKPPEVMQMSVESAAWSSMGSSGLSKSSGETIRSQSDSTHSRDLMQVSAESAEFKSKHQETSEKTQIIETSHTYKSESQTEVHHVTETSYTKSSVYESDKDSLEEFKTEYPPFRHDMVQQVSSSPFLTQGPYQEKKRVYTMTEWEAMKDSKRKSPPKSSDPDSISDPVCPPTSISPTHVGLATSKTSDSSRAAHGEEQEEEEAEIMEGDDSSYSSLAGATGEEESTRLLLKKEVHKKTTIGPDGHEEVMIREDLQVRQDNEPPEELRDSMQEIINQFMETTAQEVAPHPKLPLEDDV